MPFRKHPLELRQHSLTFLLRICQHHRFCEEGEAIEMYERASAPGRPLEANSLANATKELQGTA